MAKILDSNGVTTLWNNTKNKINTTVAPINDSVYPLTPKLELSLSEGTVTCNATVSRGITADSVNATLKVLVNDAEASTIATETLSNVDSIGKSFTSTYQLVNDSTINGNRLIFTLTAESDSLTTKDTIITKYVVMFGGSTNTTIISNTTPTGLTMGYVSDLDFNVDVTIEEGQYIWVIVPSYLDVTSIEQSSIPVAMNTAILYTDADGNSWKAYRSVNSLKASSWKLNIR